MAGSFFEYTPRPDGKYALNLNGPVVEWPIEQLKEFRALLKVGINSGHDSILIFLP